jgi:hypothetical protein
MLSNFFGTSFWHYGHQPLRRTLVLLICASAVAKHLKHSAWLKHSSAVPMAAGKNCRPGNFYRRQGFKVEKSPLGIKFFNPQNPEIFNLPCKPAAPNFNASTINLRLIVLNTLFPLHLQLILLDACRTILIIISKYQL